MKLFRWMNILNAMHALAYAMSMLCSYIGHVQRNAAWIRAAGYLIVGSLVVPAGALVWLAALISYIRNYDKEGYRSSIGRKKYCFILWPLTGIVLFTIAFIMLAVSSGV